MKADIVLLSARETKCMIHRFGHSTVFPVFSFSLKDSRIPFSLGHCHSQYIHYNIYLSIIRNCRLIMNEINSPNFVNQLPLSRYTPIYF